MAGTLARGPGRWREDRPGAAWGGAGADGWEVGWRGALARSRCVGGGGGVAGEMRAHRGKADLRRPRPPGLLFLPF